MNIFRTGALSATFVLVGTLGLAACGEQQQAEDPTGGSSANASAAADPPERARVAIPFICEASMPESVLQSCILSQRDIPGPPVQFQHRAE
jgi:hypothetical protein